MPRWSNPEVRLLGASGVLKATAVRTPRLFGGRGISAAHESSGSLMSVWPAPTSWRAPVQKSARPGPGARDSLSARLGDAAMHLRAPVAGRLLVVVRVAPGDDPVWPTASRSRARSTSPARRDELPHEDSPRWIDRETAGPWPDVHYAD